MRKIFLLLFLIVIENELLSQAVGIGTSTPNNSAILELSSDTKGVLLPRMSTAQRNAIVNPATGLTIFNTDDQCNDIFDGLNWIKNCGLRKTGDALMPGNNWIQKANLGAMGRYAAASFTILVKGYVATGFASDGLKKDLWEYDPLSNAWSQKADFGGEARYGAVGFSIGNKGYVGTGMKLGSSAQSKDFWEYDAVSNTWTQKTDFGGAARYYAVGFSINSKGYIGTGNSNTGVHFNDLWEYDPGTDTWTQKTSMGAVGRSNAIAFSASAKGYVGTGMTATTRLSDLWEYDPAGNSWTAKANFAGAARSGSAAFSIGDYGYVGTGFTDAGVSNDFWEYSVATNTWTQRTSFTGSSRLYAVGFSIDNKGYLGTGTDFANHDNDFWQYNKDPFSVPNYTTITNLINQSNVTDAIWSRNVLNEITSKGDKFRITPEGNVGIGQLAPGFPLTLNNNNGDKISLKGQTGVHTGFGVQNNLLQIHTDVIQGDIAFGYGSSSTFTENMRIRGNGNVGIGIIPPPGTSALLELNSTTKGFLFPRMTTAQRNAISGPLVGLTIFNLDDNCTDTYDGSKWIKICGYKQGDSIALAANTWVQKATLPGSTRSDGISFSIGNKGYLGLGFSSAISDLWEYDQSTNAWSQKANFPGPTPRVRAVGFNIGPKGYVGTGSNGSVFRYNDLWEYDPATNAWTARASMPAPAREMAVGFSIGNKGYVGTGWTGSFANDFLEFDPATNSWTLKAFFGGTGRQSAVAFSTSTKGFIATGYDAGGSKNDLWEYDPVANTWTSRAAMPGPARNKAAAFAIGNKGYVGTGQNNSGGYFRDFYEFDAITLTWAARPDFMGSGRSGGSGFSIGTKGYFAAGFDTENRNDLWEYNTLPFNSAFYSALPSHLAQHTISDGIWTKLASGQIFSLNNTVTITPAANLGIGNNNPNLPLSFANTLGGKINLFNTGTNSNYGIGVQVNLFQIHSDASTSDISFGYGNSSNYTERARIINTGEYGMLLRGRLQLESSGPSAGVWMKNNANSSNAGFMGMANDLNIGFYGPAGAGYGLTMNTATGNVGIGLNGSSPLRPLTFASTLGEKILLFQGAAGEVGLGVYNNELRIHTDYSGADISFGHQNNAASFTEIMRIKNTGFVGIGNINPTRPLSFPPLLGEKILLYPGGSGEVGIGVYGNELRIHCDNPGSMVSFGTQDNLGNFTQAGRFQLTGGYGLFVNGNIWANGTSYSSDERFKEDITSISSPLQKLMQIKGVEYRMKADEFPANNFSTDRQIGFLAQNIEKIIPEAVNEINGYKGVDYARLVPLLVEAIKEQQKQIEELRTLLKK